MTLAEFMTQMLETAQRFLDNPTYPYQWTGTVLYALVRSYEQGKLARLAQVCNEFIKKELRG